MRLRRAAGVQLTPRAAETMNPRVAAFARSLVAQEREREIEKQALNARTRYALAIKIRVGKSVR